MPGKNGTGPMGMGPQTGRGFGNCLTPEGKTDQNQPLMRGFGRRCGPGFGRGGGRGFGRRMGFGWESQTVLPPADVPQHASPTTPSEAPPSMASDQLKASEQLVQTLKNQVTGLEAELEYLRKRLAELSVPAKE